MLKRRTGVYAELRLQRICAALQEHGEVSVAELCEQFSMSAATIRADLAKLEAQQLLRRTHGGAIPWERPVWKPPIREIPPQSKTAKAMIAQKACRYLRPGSVVALDAGTTTLELARCMRELQDLTVITNDARIARCLEQAGGIDTLLLGGLLQRTLHCAVGADVLQALEQMHIDTLFLAADGVSVRNGLSTASFELANIKRKLIAAASRVVLLADKDKVGNDALAYFAPLSAVDVIISDADLAEPLRQEPSTRYVEFVHAGEPEERPRDTNRIVSCCLVG